MFSIDPTSGEEAWHSASISPAHAALLGVSCPSETLCVAVDEAGNVLTSTDPTGGAGAWTSANVGTDALTAVSCPSESLCVALDGHGDVFSSTEAPSGGAWAAAYVDTSTSPPLRGVSCASASLCVASSEVFIPPHCRLCVDGQLFGELATSTDPAGGAGAWSVEATAVGEAPALGVSCPSSSLCAVAGEGFVSASTDPAGGASTWSEEAGWVHPPLLEPETEYFGPGGTISCTASSLCVADGDSFNDFDSLISSTDPAGGEAQWSEPIPASRISGSGNLPSPPYRNRPILGVSCASESLCAAVDATGNVLTSTDPASGESTWTMAPVDTHSLLGISCPTTHLCVAVDSAGDIVGTTNPTGGSAAWHLSSVDSPNRLTAVSCAPEALCVAVDDEGSAFASSAPLSGPAAWSASNVDSSQNASRALNAVSCVPAGLCVAVDNAGYALTGHFLPQQDGGNGEERPPPIFSNVFTIGRTTVRCDGRIVLSLTAPGPGAFVGKATATTAPHVKAEAGHKNPKHHDSTCSAHRVTRHRKPSVTSRKGRHRKGKHRRIAYGAGSTTASTAGIVRLTIKPRSAALRALRNSNWLKVRIAVTFAPNSGAERTKGKIVSVNGR